MGRREPGSGPVVLFKLATYRMQCLPPSKPVRLLVVIGCEDQQLAFAVVTCYIWVPGFGRFIRWGLEKLSSAF